MRDFMIVTPIGTIVAVLAAVELMAAVLRRLQAGVGERRALLLLGIYGFALLMIGVYGFSLHLPSSKSPIVAIVVMTIAAVMSLCMTWAIAFRTQPRSIDSAGLSFVLCATLATIADITVMTWHREVWVVMNFVGWLLILFALKRFIAAITRSQ